MKDGGKAFPYHPRASAYGEGMTLRDYFAAAALPAIIAEGGLETMQDRSIAGAMDLAVVAYGIADAMIERRDAAREPQSHASEDK